MHWNIWMRWTVTCAFLLSAVGCNEYADLEHLEQGLTVCDDGTVYENARYVCDTVPDCRDGSDESADRCDEREFDCEWAGGTYTYADRCDGVADCDYNEYDEDSEGPSDELNCNHPPAWELAAQTDAGDDTGHYPNTYSEPDDDPYTEDDAYTGHDAGVYSDTDEAFDGSCPFGADRHGGGVVTCLGRMHYDPDQCGSWHICGYREMRQRMESEPVDNLWIAAYVRLEWDPSTETLEARVEDAPNQCIEPDGRCTERARVQAQTNTDPAWNDKHPAARWAGPAFECGPDGDFTDTCETGLGDGVLCCR